MVIPLLDTIGAGKNELSGHYTFDLLVFRGKTISQCRLGN